jgi:hypothetical protein
MLTNTLNNFFGTKFFQIVLLITFFHMSLVGFAQISNYDFGARSQGIANANASVADEWAIFNNVGGISGVEKGTVFFGYDRYFDIEGFDKVAVGVIQPIKYGSLGISANRFGDDLYSEQMVSGAFGNKIGFVRLGLRANYFQMRIDEFGSSSVMFFDMGGIVELIPTISFGAYVSNFTVARLNNEDRTKLPVIMKIGLSYTPTEDIMFNIDLYKDVEFDPLLKAGLEYKIIDKVFLRTGMNTKPFKVFFGGGILLGRFAIDYAVTSHQFLGMSHQASVSFNYQK